MPFAVVLSGSVGEMVQASLRDACGCCGGVPGVGNAGLLSDVPTGHGGGFNGVEPALESRGDVG